LPGSGPAKKTGGCGASKKERLGVVIRVSIEVVSGGADRFNLSVRAGSIRRAVSTVKGLYPGSDVRVAYPIEPETFFVRDAAASMRPTEVEMPKSVAG
jgi:hypothetical protein